MKHPRFVAPMDLGLRISEAMGTVEETGSLNAAASATSEVGAGDRLVLTVSEAAHALGISRAFAYELVAQDKLPSLRLGRRVVIPLARFQEFLSESTPSSPRPTSEGHGSSRSRRRDGFCATPDP